METLGIKLKSLREGKGMTLKDVSKATKIREFILLALENEEWEKLPQRIFIKGFVMAYAKTVEGDVDQIMDLFESSCPVKDEAITCPTYETESINNLEKGRKIYKWTMVLVVLLLIVGGVYLFYTFFYRPRMVSKASLSEETTVVKPAEGVKEETVKSAPREASAQVYKVQPSEESPSSAGKSAPIVPSTGVIQPDKGNKEGNTSQEMALSTTHPLKEQPASSEKPAGMEAAIKEGAVTAEAENVPKDNLVITAKMETWIGLTIDGEIRKEVLLKPGESFSTRVEKSVKLLIGNAGGIDILFNGKKVENIGKPGQVVRLKLPLEKE